MVGIRLGARLVDGLDRLLSPVLTYSLEMASLAAHGAAAFRHSDEPGARAAALMGFLVLGQRLSPAQLAGMACVTLASLGTVAARPKKT